VHIQMAESSDFNTWSLVKNSDGSQKDALPDLPSWVDGGNSNTVSAWPVLAVLIDNVLTYTQWAPDVIVLVSHNTSPLSIREPY
jgi:hypothetical protein